MLNVNFVPEVIWTDEEIIRTQQTLAREILRKLRIKFPTAILAGGAPRDWYRGKPAKDLDFFVKYDRWGSDLDADATNWSKVATPPQELLNDCGLYGFATLGFMGGDNAAEYGFDPELYVVKQNTSYVTPVQVMFETVTDILNILPKFGVSISQIAWDGENYITTQIFDDSVACKAIVETGELYKTRDNYRAKIKSYFPDFRYFKRREDFYEWRGAACGA